MSSIDEKRVHGPNTQPIALFVAADIGLLRATVAGERVGEVSLFDRRPAHDLALADGRVVVATDEDVLIASDGSLEPTGFGPATAIGIADRFVAAAPDGTVARRDDDGWVECGTVDSVRAIDGDLIAAADGVYRLADDDLDYVGLDDVRDVAHGTPRAATATGLYRLGNGWLDELDGDFEMVADGPEGAHAATADRLYAFDGDWKPVSGIERSVVDIARGQYAVCADGTLLSATEDEWRAHPLGAGTARALVARSDRKPV